MIQYRLGRASALVIGLNLLGAGFAQAQIGIPLILGPGGLIGGGGLELPGRVVGSLINGYPLIQYGGVSPSPEPGFNGAPTGGQSPLDPSVGVDDPSFTIATSSTRTATISSGAAHSANAPASSRVIGLGAPILPSIAGGLVSGLVNGTPLAGPVALPGSQQPSAGAAVPSIPNSPSDSGQSSLNPEHSNRIAG